MTELMIALVCLSLAAARLPIALHLSQDLLPLTGAGGLANGAARQPTKVVGSGSGYGPPLAPEGTPLSRLVAQTLYVPPAASAEPTPSEAAAAAAAQGAGGGWSATGGKTEYDLVCIPLTNGNWQERWERMCTITASATEADLGAVASGPLGMEEAARIEAETWRAGGSFRRNEVNLTRSGERGAEAVRRVAELMFPVVRLCRGSWQLDCVCVRLARARQSG